MNPFIKNLSLLQELIRSLPEDPPGNLFLTVEQKRNLDSAFVWCQTGEVLGFTSNIAQIYWQEHFRCRETVDREFVINLKKLLAEATGCREYGPPITLEIT